MGLRRPGRAGDRIAGLENLGCNDELSGLRGRPDA
jgi:hypothetical protein